MDKIQNFIGGQWVSPESNRWSKSYNPANGEIVGEIVVSSANDVDLAVRTAHQAYPQWRSTGVTDREKLLWRMAEQLEQNKEMLAQSITLEMGKVYAEALGEVNATIASCKYMAGEARRLFGQTVPSMFPNRTAVISREPLGVVACISPWNFPIALASYKIFSGLVAGNTIVWKPASDVAVTAAKFAQTLQSAEIPNGVFNVVFGSGQVVGNALATHPLVQVVAFTGSTEVGKDLAEIAGRHLKRISLELGGKNAVIVLADADLDAAAKAIVKSAFATTGQRCTAASRVIVERPVEKALVEKILALTGPLKLGFGLREGVEVGPVANRKQLETVENYVAVALQEGAQLVAGGHREHIEGLDSDLFYAPTVLVEVRPEHTIAKEEVFGPVLSILRVENLQEAIDVNNNTEYGLCSSIFTNDLKSANYASRELISGMVFVNDGTIMSETGMPFGGMKQSGNGHREVSYHAFDVMTEWKTTYTTY